MTNNKDIGDYGELLASEYLIKKGYKVLEKKYRSKFGEIDIIAQQNDILYFVEVKARYSDKYGHPCEAISRKKYSNILKTAQIFVSKNKLFNYNMQIDAVEITLNYNNDNYTLNHICNIF